jgi:hypothetical protein
MVSFWTLMTVPYLTNLIDLTDWNVGRARQIHVGVACCRMVLEIYAFAALISALVGLAVYNPEHSI